LSLPLVLALRESNLFYPRVVATVVDVPHPEGKATHPPA
jgi:hypothetical protein